MRSTSHVALVAAAIVATACVDAPTSPGSAKPEGLTSGALLAAGQHDRHVIMTDRCDPTSFNAVLGDGACVRSGGGGVTFEEFIAQLTSTQDARAWRFIPSFINTTTGSTITAYNRGGEVHTFTPVATFGGGFVNELNGISGNPVPAPECLNFGAIVFVPPGESDEVTVAAPGEHHFQCCIHPWMRATARVR